MQVTVRLHLSIALRVAGGPRPVSLLSNQFRSGAVYCMTREPQCLFCVARTNLKVDREFVLLKR